jgi:hypothetical protein
MFLNICMGNLNSSYLFYQHRDIPNKLFYRKEMYNTGQTFATDCSPVGYKYHLFDTKTGQQLGEMEARPVLYNIGNRAFYPQVAPYKSFEIDYLKSNVRDKGNGSKFITLAKNESKALGCKGRVHLIASRAYDYDRPPHVFYKKMGFVSNSSKMNKYLDKCIKFGLNVGQSKSNPLKMYLPYTPTETPKVSTFGKLFKFFKGLKK